MDAIKLKLIRQMVSNFFFAIGALLLVDAILSRTERGHLSWPEIFTASGLFLIGILVRYLKLPLR